MRFSFLLISVFLLGLLIPNSSYALVNNSTNNISISSKKEIKKNEKRQKRVEKRMDKLNKLIAKSLGISEAKAKEMSSGLKTTLIVACSILLVVLIFLPVWFLIIKPIISAE